jgi:hypothetical protein
MNTGPKHFPARRRPDRPSWIQGFHAAVSITALVVMLMPTTAWSHPQTRQGFFIGLGLASGSAAVGLGEGVSSDRESGTGGSFRMGWTLNPKFALGLENNSWFKSDESGAATLGAVTVAGSFFPAEGLVLRAGLGGGYEGEASDGVGGSAGFAWTLGAAYEFRVTRSFALGPQIDYTRMNLEFADADYYNIGLSMNWYFIPK